MPERVFVTNGESSGSTTGGATGGLLGTLIGLLVAEKSGFQLTDANGRGMGSLQEFANTMTKEAMASMQQAALSERAATAVVTAPTADVEKT